MKFNDLILMKFNDPLDALFAHVTPSITPF